MKISPQDKLEAVAKLQKMLIPGARVYTGLNHVSASGMQRAISLYIATVDDYNGANIIQRLDYWASRALGIKISPKHGGLIVNGCGMDMGFSLVYKLGQELWPQGTPAPHGTRNGAPDNAGGYALKHEWL